MDAIKVDGASSILAPEGGMENGKAPLTERRGFFRFMQDSMYKVMYLLKSGTTDTSGTSSKTGDGVRGMLSKVKGFRRRVKSDPSSTLAKLGSQTMGFTGSLSHLASDISGGLTTKALSAPVNMVSSAIGWGRNRKYKRMYKNLTKDHRNRTDSIRARQRAEERMGNLTSAPYHMRMSKEDRRHITGKEEKIKRTSAGEKVGFFNKAVTLPNGRTVLQKPNLSTRAKDWALGGLSRVKEDVMGFGGGIISGIKGRWAEKSKEAGGGLAGGAKATASLVGDAIGGVTGGIVGAMSKGFSALLGPIGIIAEVVQMLAGSSPLLKAVLQLFQLAFTLFFMPFGNILGEILLPLMMDLINWVVAFNEWIAELNMNAIIDWFHGVWEGLKDFFGGIFDAYIQFFKNIISTITGVFEWLWGHLGGILGKVWDTIKSIFTKIVDLVQAFFKLPAQIGNAVWNAIKGVGSSVWDGVTGFFGFSGGGYIPPTPGGTLIRVGEGTRGEYIVPVGSQMESKLGGGGQTINITFSGPVYGMNDFENKVNDIISKASNRGYYR